MKLRSTLFANKFFTITVFSLLICSLGCEPEIIPEIYHPKTDHEAYLLGLKDAGLEGTALGQAWINISDEVLDQPRFKNVPFIEAFYFSEIKAEALAFEFAAKRGEKIQATIEILSPETTDTSLQLFIDLFRQDSLQNLGWVHIASSDRKLHRLAFEPRQDARYLLRIQPELLRGGRLELKVASSPALAFPVAGGNNRDIGSFFGDPRDGGRRKHHGIDIFAKRHTPIVAPTDGHIRFVGERGLGGRVIWMRDIERNMTLYFAHLQDFLVEDDTWVKMGDTIGTVGNTGNARTTPPHLHFGIYQDGPIDPYHFVALNNKKIRELRANELLLGFRVRAKYASHLFASASNNEKIKRITKHQWMQIISANRDRYGVRLASGEIGYVAASNIETLDKPVKIDISKSAYELLDHASSNATLVDTGKAEEPIQLLARDQRHWFVRTNDGHLGWIEGTFAD